GKSAISCTWRISITSFSPPGQRLAHSIASSLDFTWIIQYPPRTSLASAKGPSVTLGLPPANDTRAPIDGGGRPAARSRMPAFCSDSLYFIIASTALASGMVPGFAVSYPFGIISIMNRIVLLLLGDLSAVRQFLAELAMVVDRFALAEIIELEQLPNLD